MGSNQERIAIITDTGCFMSSDEAKEKGIFLLPLQIIVDDESFDDLIEIDTEEIYKKLNEGRNLKTSMPKYQVIYDLLIQIKNEGYNQAICIPLTPGISSTCSVIQSISNEIELQMNVIDCFTTCQLQKNIVNHVHWLIENNYNTDQILAITKARIYHSNTYILSRDIQHLKKGGRLTPIAASVASMAKIYPILTMNKNTNGRIDVFSKVRTDKKAIKSLCEVVLNDIDNNYQIYILHSDDLKSVNNIKQHLINSGIKEENIKIEYLNSVVAVHVGLKCIAIQYIKKVEG